MPDDHRVRSTHCRSLGDASPYGHERRTRDSLDEVFVRINRKQHYLWRAVDQDGEIVHVYLQDLRDGAAANRFFKRLLRSHGGEPRKIVTDKLRSDGGAHRELIPELIYSTEQYENNRAE